MELWEKQPEETGVAYEAFCVYRDMKAKAGKRSQELVSKELGKSMALMNRWSSRHEWVKRAEAFDEEQERKEREAYEKARLGEIIKMRKRHAAIAYKMMETVEAAIDTLNLEDLKPADIPRMADIAAKIERISRGDVGDVVEERDGGQAPPAVSFYMPHNNRDNKVVEE